MSLTESQLERYRRITRTAPRFGTDTTLEGVRRKLVCSATNTKELKALVEKLKFDYTTTKHEIPKKAIFEAIKIVVEAKLIEERMLNDLKEFCKELGIWDVGFAKKLEV